MKPAFLTWLAAAKRRAARISKQFQHSVPAGIV